MWSTACVLRLVSGCTQALYVYGTVVYIMYVTL